MALYQNAFIAVMAVSWVISHGQKWGIPAPPAPQPQPVVINNSNVVGAIVSFVQKRREEARRQIAARADAECRASLEGNPAGTYGQYPPPPLPEPDHWLPPSVT
ncbi:hypothetical protein [Candidatus Mycobacterium methanotrophicum]|uniref:Uncharacterized protein n=1 Tax=Candidatus Mycobacterium methanotrophicum TaxID=2943498 RepID=A0ABY4QHU1_9MYCO|nr:hypothetical protein [Candidatus Mycobacterium methanotrophicum]UQX09787.1 hypothetical protein M5I08_15955 [Candidatus Mycobacterium methanotrophicum]